MQITHMQLTSTQSHGSYIEQIMRAKNGASVRATFYIYQSAGRLKARLVSIAPIFVLSAAKIISSISSELSGFSIGISLIVYETLLLGWHG